MRDVEPHWRAEPSRIFEVSPELSFATLHGRAWLSHPKRTWAGRADADRAVGPRRDRVPADLGPAGAAGVDDVLDAAAVAWTAARLATGPRSACPTHQIATVRGRRRDLGADHARP